MFYKNIFKIIKRIPQKIWELEDIKNYIRISHNYDDNLIYTLLNASINAAENFTGLSITEKEVQFVCSVKKNKSYLLKYAPITEITKITLKKKDEEEIIKIEDYYLDISRSIVYLETSSTDADLLIDYVCGFNENTIPGAIKYGVLMHSAYMYDREDQSDSLLPLEIKNLYIPYRQLRI